MAPLAVEVLPERGEEGAVEADVGADLSASTVLNQVPAAVVNAAVEQEEVEAAAAAAPTPTPEGNNSVAAVAAAVVPLFLAGRHKPRRSH